MLWFPFCVEGFFSFPLMRILKQYLQVFYVCLIWTLLSCYMEFSCSCCLSAWLVVQLLAFFFFFFFFFSICFWLRMNEWMKYIILSLGLITEAYFVSDNKVPDLMAQCFIEGIQELAIAWSIFCYILQLWGFCFRWSVICSLSRTNLFTLGSLRHSGFWEDSQLFHFHRWKHLVVWSSCWG